MELVDDLFLNKRDHAQAATEGERAHLKEKDCDFEQTP